MFPINFCLMKKKTLNLIKLVLKYLLPAVLGWIEGDSHAVADAIVGLISIF